MGAAPRRGECGHGGQRRRAPAAAHPARAPAGARRARGGPGDRPRSERILLATCGPTDDDAEAVEDWFARSGHPALEDVLGVRVSTWRTDPTPNRFPRLPVRRERALAWLASFPDADARDDAAARWAAAPAGRELGRRTRWHRTSRLTPTPRSAHPRAEPPSAGATVAPTAPVVAG